MFPVLWPMNLFLSGHFLSCLPFSFLLLLLAGVQALASWPSQLASQSRYSSVRGRVLIYRSISEPVFSQFSASFQSYLPCHGSEENHERVKRHHEWSTSAVFCRSRGWRSIPLAGHHLGTLWLTLWRWDQILRQQRVNYNGFFSKVECFSWTLISPLIILSSPPSSPSPPGSTTPT